MKKNNYQVAADVIQKGSFLARVFAYLVFYIPISFVLAAVLELTLPVGEWANDFTVQLEFYGFFMAMLIPFILWELLIRWSRRSSGFSVDKNIETEIEQRKEK